MRNLMNEKSETGQWYLIEGSYMMTQQTQSKERQLLLE
jgi:hypothetical protein